ncbi:MAG: DEAD/DEAH box helicase [Bacteroidota bacterium]
MHTFKELGLSETILDVLEQIGFETPTEVQAQAIPMLLENEATDFIGLAQTGTGKTAAFGLPLLDLLDPTEKATQVLIMAPTRELGKQIAQQLEDFSRNNGSVHILAVYGGEPISKQIKALRRPVQILVATPGRLLDLIRRNAVHLENVRHVVLDEADEMLNMGFKEDIDAILEHTGEERAIWLFSATMPPAIRRIVTKYMQAPLEVVVNSTEISNKDITHQYVVTKVADKLDALRRFLDIHPEMRGVLFCRTKRETEQIAQELGAIGYDVAALNGDMSQQQRDKVMKLFKARSMQLLIATDVAARGIDVKDLSHVLHHSLPDQMEYYTHRSGRTGRAGKKGISLAFINPREQRKIVALERRIRIQFEKVQVPSAAEVLSRRINNWANLIVNTKVHAQAESVLASLGDQFAELTKEELLQRLISTQLDHLMLQEGNQGDLNAGGGPRRKEPRAGKSGSDSGAAEAHRFFINLGMIDGVTKADLIHFLSDVSGVKRKFIQQVALKKNCAFFNVAAAKSAGFGEKFDGIEIDGRMLRVNRDQGPAPSGHHRGRPWENTRPRYPKKPKAKGAKKARKKKKAKGKRK